MALKFNLRENIFRILYWLVNKADRNADILFMNFGFSNDGQTSLINEKNDSDRYSAQLYHHLAIETEINNKDIVDIGCGRGGGLSYVTRHFSPASAIGIDREKTAIFFCNRHYKHKCLSFLQSDAQKLSLENNSCDVVINVESSHRYPNMQSFLGEVLRILRPYGYFLFTDFRYDHEIEGLKRELSASGMSVLKERFINKEVIAALELDDERRRDLVYKLVPKFLHKIALNFAGTVGSETYYRFVTGKYVYFSYVLRKQ